jgi:demethylmacrocin O-methyltransferase
MEALKLTLGEKGYKLIKAIYLFILSIPFGWNLNMLARIYKSDKWGKHHYTEHYSKHFRKLRFKRIRLFEIGAGGYHYPGAGGNSLRMWKRYFPFGRIFSLDIYDKSFLDERRIKIFQGNQNDEIVLNEIIDLIGEPDIIIDDGSHINADVINTFKILFPRLKTGGIYVIEDTETSYWPDYGGDSDNLSNRDTTMNFFKSITDCLNHQEIIRKGYIPSHFDKSIYSIQFYHNLIWIFKGINDEESNVDLADPESIMKDKIYI